MAEFTWDVFLPGEDLPHRVTTDYLVGDGEAVMVDGREWLADSVEIEDEHGATGKITVVAPEGPLAPTDDPG